MGSDPLPAPAVPAEARRVFHVERLGLAERYAAWLADAGTVRGLIGPREVPRLWERHLLNCAVIAPEVRANASLADLGSGAGLPGLVLAIARPDVAVTLVEPLLRRTTFLGEVVADLGLDNVEVVRGRAESLHGVRVFDVVTSRAVAGLGTLLDWSMPLVAPGGELLAMKGGTVAAEIDQAEEVLAKWGCSVPVVEELGDGVLSTPTTVVRISWADPSSAGSASGSRGARGQLRGRRSGGRGGRGGRR